MPDSAPKPPPAPNETHPPAKPAAGNPSPVGAEPKRSQPVIPKTSAPVIAKGSSRVIAKDSSEVIARGPGETPSQRVRELPPPPKVIGGPPARPAVAPPPLLPQVLEEESLADQLAAAPVDLARLDIRSSGRDYLRRGRRFIRPAAPWLQWLVAPQVRSLVGFGASLAGHLALLLALALLVAHGPAEPIIHARSLQSAAETVAADGPLIQPMPPEAALTSLEVASTGAETAALAGAAGPDVGRVRLAEVAAASAAEPLGRLPVPGLLAGGAASGTAAAPDWMLAADTRVDGKLDRRTPDGRSQAVHYGGGSTESEEAVERALRWLLAHQRDDGSWHFNHTTDACLHYCTNPGAEASTTAATALALLPFLGAGHTHQKGEYQDAVGRALKYLCKRGVAISYGTDFRDGSMYGHALAMIALCEAYAMTHDPALQEPAQGGIHFIAYAQDSKGGGWRYNPGEPGDTTVTGWMLMALKSAQMAGLETPSPVIFAAERFLTSVQRSEGAEYCYMPKDRPRPTTTAVGLLCRMYTGWRRTNPALMKGVAQLNAWGPSKDDLYFNYYATQVMFHAAGPEWDAWNQKMRNLLIATQGRAGHEAGSWYFDHKHAKAGGRLYCTAVSAMILEVYYRYMPLYSESAVKREF